MLLSGLATLKLKYKHKYLSYTKWYEPFLSIAQSTEHDYNIPIVGFTYFIWEELDLPGKFFDEPLRLMKVIYVISMG